jgi:hypothetical protein
MNRSTSLYASVAQERSWRGFGFGFAAYGHHHRVLLAEQIGAQYLARLFEQGARLDPEAVCRLTLEAPREVDA